MKSISKVINKLNYPYPALHGFEKQQSSIKSDEIHNWR